MEQAAIGYNNASWDFQVIVAENALSGSSPVPYYSYVELD